jgi:hypothetical protein
MHPEFPDGPGLVSRRVHIARQDVAFLRYVLEAEEGVAFLHGDGSGAVWVLAPESRAMELDKLIADLITDGHLLGVCDATPI